MNCDVYLFRKAEKGKLLVVCVACTCIALNWREALALAEGEAGEHGPHCIGGGSAALSSRSLLGPLNDVRHVQTLFFPAIRPISRPNRRYSPRRLRAV